MGTPFDLLAYGFLMSVLGVTAARFAPELNGLLLVTGGLGGGIGLFWGLWGLRHPHYPRWAGLTLAAFTLLLGGVSAVVWRAGTTNGTETRLTLMMTGLMLFFTFAQFLLLWRENKSQPP